MVRLKTLKYSDREWLATDRSIVEHAGELWDVIGAQFDEDLPHFYFAVHTSLKAPVQL